MLSLDIWLGFVAHDIAKYLLAAGIAYLILHVLLAGFLAARRIQRARAATPQIAREIAWSLLSAAIFATASLLAVFVPAERGWNRIYFDLDALGWGYAAFSLILMIVAHDAYFYWTHRLMHLPAALRITHRTHHRSRTPTPWAAYRFDPIEAFLQVAFAPLFAMLLPLHPSVLLLWSIHMVLRNVIGHCGFEIFPKGMARSRWFGWITGVTHHDLHHRTARWNFGLYFTWWDRWMGTEHPHYLTLFEAAASASGPQDLALVKEEAEVTG